MACKKVRGARPIALWMKGHGFGGIIDRNTTLCELQWKSPVEAVVVLCRSVQGNPAVVARGRSGVRKAVDRRGCQALLTTSEPTYSGWRCTQVCLRGSYCWALLPCVLLDLYVVERGATTWQWKKRRMARWSKQGKNSKQSYRLQSLPRISDYPGPTKMTASSPSYLIQAAVQYAQCNNTSPDGLTANCISIFHVTLLAPHRRSHGTDPSQETLGPSRS